MKQLTEQQMIERYNRMKEAQARACKKYRDTHLEQVKSQQSEYYKRNAEARKQRMKAYYLKKKQKPTDENI